MTLNRSQFPGVERQTRFLSPSFRPQLTLLAIALQGILLSLAVGVVLPHAAQAQAATALPAGDEIRSFNVPAGALVAALDRFARTARVNLSYDTALLSGLQSRELSGSYSIASALSMLLAGSGIEAVAQPGGGYSLRKAPVATNLSSEVDSSAAARKAEATMPEVTVTTSTERDPRTEGTRSYTASAVSIGKTPQALRDIPQSVSVMTRQRMDDQNLFQVESALDQMTGLQFDTSTGPAGSANVISRGFLINNYQADGVPQTFLGTSFTSLDLASYDRIEVIRGSAGLLQGVGNPSATVNLVRKKPGHQFAASVAASAGSWDFYRAEADIGGPLNDAGTLRARVVAVHEDRNYNVKVMESRKDMLYGVIELDLGPATMRSLGLQRQQTNAVPLIFGLPRYSDGRSLGLPRSTFLAPAWSRWSQDIDDAFFNIEHYLANGWKLNVGGNSTPQDQDFKRTVMRGTGAGFGVNPANPAASIYTGVSWQSEGTRRNFDANASGKVTLFGRQHELTIGVNAQDYVSRTRQSAFFAAVPVPNIFNSDPYSVPEPNEGPFISGTTLRTHQHGVYSSGRFTLAKDLKLILGARVSWYETSTDNHNLLTGTTVQGRKVRYDRELTPYAGLIYKLDPTYSLYASYADIFLPQSAQFTASGGELDPIVGANYEAGIKGEYLGGAVNASLAMFRINQSNRAFEDPAAPCAIAVIVNGCYRAEGKVRSEGIETEISGRLAPQLDLFAGYTFNMTSYLKDKANQGLAFRPQTPRHMFKLWAQWGLPWDASRWSLGGGLNTQSGYYALNGAVRSEQAAYTITSLRLSYRPTQQWQLALNLNNLFDKTYYSSIRGIDFGNVYGEPRNAMLTARMRF